MSVADDFDEIADPFGEAFQAAFNPDGTFKDSSESRDISFIEDGSVWKALEDRNLISQLSSASTRREYLATLPLAQVIGATYFVAALTTGSALHVRVYDHAPVMLVTPNIESANPAIPSKSTLWISSVNAAQQILRDKSLSDEVALRRAGLTLSGSLDLIHPLYDGNGRVGRIIQYVCEFGTELG